MDSTPLQVTLHRCEQYDRYVIAELIDLSLSQLGLSGSFYAKKVLLKPNLVSSFGPSLSCTHGEFVAGAVLWFLDHGAKVMLGDSPAFGSATRVCQKQGITESLKGLKVEMIDFISPVTVQLDGGTYVSVAKEALECDYFVGLPKIKAHNQMFVSLAVKNIFGIVKGINKAMIHMVHGRGHQQFSGIILDLLKILPPHLHIADSIVVMSESGPVDGTPLPVNCLAAAINPVALDTALLDLLSLDAGKSPLWYLASSRGLAGSERSTLVFPFLAPCDFSGTGFIAPENLNSIRFNFFRFLRGMVKRISAKSTL